MTLTAACSRLAEVEDFNAVACDCCVNDPDDIEALLDNASDMLYALSSGAVFGQCETTVRPCRACWCQRCWACCHLDALPLRYDAFEIVSIKINGDTLDPSTYLLHHDGKVTKVATDRRPTAWPNYQDLWKPDTQDRTFSVTYRFGQEVIPKYVKDACVELACASARTSSPGQKQLSTRVTSIFTGNASYQLERTADSIRAVGSELPAVATFLSIVDRGFKGPAGIYSPDGIDGWTFVVDS